jgi:hypothetical protein
MPVRKALILSTCFGFALLDHAGVASAAEETYPIPLTASQMDKVTAGLDHTAVNSAICHTCPIKVIRVVRISPPIVPPYQDLPPILPLLEHR